MHSPPAEASATIRFFVFGVLRMAVQQNKKSPSRRGMRRSHCALAKRPLAVDSVHGEAHRRHHVSPSGVYRGRQVVEAPAVDEEKEEE